MQRARRNLSRAAHAQQETPVSPWQHASSPQRWPLNGLNRLPLRLSYRSGRDDLVRDLFIPCLETATLYRRAAGYFTSAGLALAARGAVVF
jgi:hypothetical protein